LRQSVPVARDIFAAKPGRWSVISGGMKLVCLANNVGRPLKLYDLKADLYELRNLVNRKEFGGRIEAMQTALNRIRREDFLQIEPVADEPQLSEEEKKKLRALGYVR
jgi:hypothetical protein